MNVFELIKEKLEEVRKYECGILNGYCQSTITKAISIIDEVAKEYPKTPTPDHPIPIDTQQYIEELEKQVMEARNKAIDEFTERLKQKAEEIMTNPNIMLDCKKCTIWKVKDIDEIAEQLKDGAQ